MKKTSLLMAAAFSSFLGAQAFAAEPVISKIDVQSDFSLVGTSMAATYWPQVEADLKAKLAAAFADRSGVDGLEVMVSIRELAVNAAAADASYKDLNAIDGTVAIRAANTDAEDTDDSPITSFRVAFSVVPPDGRVMEGVMILPPNTADNYNALLDAIVADVKKHVDDVKM